MASLGQAIQARPTSSAFFGSIDSLRLEAPGAYQAILLASLEAGGEQTLDNALLTVGEGSAVPTEIPTLSTFGLAAMASMLALGARRALRRRRAR